MSLSLTEPPGSGLDQKLISIREQVDEKRCGVLSWNLSFFETLLHLVPGVGIATAAIASCRSDEQIKQISFFESDDETTLLENYSLHQRLVRERSNRIAMMMLNGVLTVTGIFVVAQTRTI